MPREVAIVGAGIVGLATAHHLLEEGWRVRLIERGGIAEGASLGNAGALAFTDVLPLASPGILRKAPRWMLDPLGPLALPPAYLPRIAPWLVRFWRASLPDRHRPRDAGPVRPDAARRAGHGGDGGVGRPD